MYKTVMNPYIPSWPTAFSTLDGSESGEDIVVLREVGKGAYELNAPPPTMRRTIRNKSKCKQQRQARKRAKLGMRNFLRIIL